MALALIKPLLSKGKIKSNSLIAVVGKESSVKKCYLELPSDVEIYGSRNPKSLNVWKAPIQLLAIKPEQLNEVARRATSVEGKPLLISIIAGVRLERLRYLFPSHRCVRVVPNTPSLVCDGLTGIAWGDLTDNKDRQEVMDIFKLVSEIVELPENKLDAFLALTSSGPAFIAMVTEALADGAVASGLPRDLAIRLSQKTLSGTASLLSIKKLHLIDLLIVALLRQI